MEANGPTATFTVELVDQRLVDEDLEELTGKLRRELLDSDVVSAERGHAGEPPPDARAGEVAALASLVVTIGTTAGALNSAIGTLRGWLGRDSGRKVVVVLDGDRLEISGSSDEEQRRMISLWIDRHEPS
jgi:hypothetical protein